MMAYAKLAGALLAHKDAAPAQTRSMTSIASVPLAGEGIRLLAQHLNTLNLPVFLAEYERLARQCAAERLDYRRYLLRLAELELVGRRRRLIERRIREARFPVVKKLDSFDFAAVPSLNKQAVLELAGCGYVARRENIIVLGDGGTGKTHIALGLGMAACQEGLSVGFVTAASLVHQLAEACDERRLLRLQRRLAAYKVLIIDELGYVPLSAAGARVLFEIVSQRGERGSTIVTSNLALDEWIDVLGTARLADAAVERLTRRARILQLNGQSYRRADVRSGLTVRRRNERSGLAGR